MSITLWLLLALVPLQIAIGDAHGLNTLEAPADQAGGDRGATGDREKRAPLTLFAIPDQAGRDQPLRHPGAAARQPDPDARSSTAKIPGLKDVPRARIGRRWRYRSSPSASWWVLRRGDAQFSWPWRATMLRRKREALYQQRGSCAPACGPRRWASSPCSPAGPPPRSAASPGRSTA